MLVNSTPANALPADDRGLAYGDGVFRTLRCVNGQPLHWARQFARLAHDCGRLSIVCPGEELLLGETRKAASTYANAAVKIIVTRGAGPRGYAPPVSPLATRIIAASGDSLWRQRSSASSRASTPRRSVPRSGVMPCRHGLRPRTCIAAAPEALHCVDRSTRRRVP